MFDRFSSEIQDLHDDMSSLRRDKEKLQDQLRRRYGQYLAASNPKSEWESADARRYPISDLDERLPERISRLAQQEVGLCQTRQDEALPSPLGRPKRQGLRPDGEPPTNPHRQVVRSRADSVALVHYGCEDGNIDREDDAGSETGILGATADGEASLPFSRSRRLHTDVQIVDISSDIQRNAGLVDELDLALSFAQTAVDSNYVRPKLTSS